MVCQIVWRKFLAICKTAAAADVVSAASVLIYGIDDKARTFFT